jgi:mRNA export factor
MAFFGTGSTSANVSSTGEKDVEVADPPPDSISTLSFCPVADFLAVGSWDNNVSRLLHLFFHMPHDVMS